MENAIKKAIEGGWKPESVIMPHYFIWRTPVNIFVSNKLVSLDFETTVKGAIKENIIIRRSEILFDLLFWQALGKQQWWDSDMDRYYCQKCEDKEIDNWCERRYCMKCGVMMIQFTYTTKNWITHWHNFIDHIAEGGSIDEFFNNLLK